MDTAQQYRESDEERREELRELLNLDSLLGLTSMGEFQNDIDLLIEVGRRYLRLRQFRLTDKYYQRALAIDPNNYWTHMYLGNLYYVQNQNGKALHQFQFAMQIDPEIPCAFWCIGDVLFSMNRVGQAESAYKKAVAVDPECEIARENLNRFYSQSRR